MAKQTLPTNFIDDILAPSMSGKRKFTITDNGDGTYEIEDVTDYTQTGSDFGAGQINATNQAVNESCDKADVIDDLDDIAANQANGKIAGAKAVATLNKYLAENFRLSETEIATPEKWIDGKRIYSMTIVTNDTIPAGGDLTIPLSLSGADRLWIDQQNSYIRSATQCFPIPVLKFSTSDDSYIGIWVNTAGIRLYSNAGWNEAWEKCVTLRYTKKTD